MDATLKVWDLESGREERTLAGHTGMVLDVAIAPDGGRVVSGAMDGALKVWDLANGTCIASFMGESGMTCCAVAPDCRTVVAGDASGRIHFFRIEGAD